jgi:putative transposase
MLVTAPALDPTTLLTKQCRGPRVLVTDKLRRSPVAHRAVMPSVEHRQSRYLNRAENLHQPTRQRERAMKRVRTPGAAHRFLAVFSVFSPLFRPCRHRLTAEDYRTEMADRLATWTDITRSSQAA